MEVSATVREKEHGRDIYNILLYLIIILLCLHGTYWFTLHFTGSSEHKDIFNGFMLRCADFLQNYEAFFRKNVLLYIILLLCVLLSMLSTPKANPKASRTKANGFLICGAALLLSGSYFLTEATQRMILIMILFSELIGVLLLLRGGLEFASMAAIPELDIFNDENEQFPQNEALVTNAFSVNYKLQFPFNRVWKEGYINVVNPQRAVLVLGSQGSGKTYTVIIPAIWQSIAKGYTALVYDVKYPDLSLEAYNALFKALKNDRFCFGRTPEGKPVIPTFGTVNFDDVSLSIRSNPLSEKYVQSIEEAGETAKVLMLRVCWEIENG